MDDNVKTGAEIAVIHLQARKPPEAGERHGTDFPPRAFREDLGLRTPRLQTTASRIVRE